MVRILLVEAPRITARAIASAAAGILISLVEGYVEHYNNVRLDTATYITPKDVLAGRQQDIHAERDR
jgi:hypothetical protein